jgi:hypothetical protein
MLRSLPDRFILFFCILILFLILPAELAFTQDSGRVAGQVVNLTNDAAVPAGLPVVLYVLEDFQPVEVMTSTLSSSGGFAFSNVLFEEGWVYVTTMEYQNVAYGSTFVTYDGSSDALQLDIEIYESTMAPSTIEINRLHVIIEFSENTMAVSELYIYDNLGDRVFVGPTGIPEMGTLELPIPENVINPSVERNMGDSMVAASNSIIAGENGYLDTLSVRPGEAVQQLMLRYEIPYKDKATISHPLPYAVKSVTLLLPDAGLQVESNQLVDAGSVASGMPYVRWDGENLAAGETLSVQISGELDESQMTSMMVTSGESDGQTASFPFFVQAGDSSLAWVIGIGGLVLAVGLVVYVANKDKHTNRANPREVCLQAIVDLDQAYEEGNISTGKYQLERERLKTELRRWISKQPEPIQVEEESIEPGKG